MLSAVLTSQSQAAEFAEITREERELASVPGQPNASAVVLFKKGQVSIVFNRSTGYLEPTLTVKVRRKILAEDGKKYGEMQIRHSQYLRLQRLKGRTVLPDGRVIPLPENATFRRRESRSEKIFVTSIAFPSVEVGAILDSTYEMRLDSVFQFEPWYFQEEVPTLLSEIVYEVPSALGISTWLQDPMRNGITREVKEKLHGVRQFVVSGKNLPAVSSEPFGVPFTDLASSIMILAASVHFPDEARRELLQSWNSTCELFGPGYEKAMKKSGAGARKAKEVAATATGASPREKAEALYRFVRDTIENTDQPGVWMPEDSTADSVLKAGRGSSAEKAILLQAMLAAVDLPSRPVWVADRDGGLLNLEFANPWWFDRVIVAAEIDGKRIFLDPSDRSLGFGHLAPGLEGMAALLFSRKNPETILLPVTPFAENLRRAKVELDLSSEGGLSGSGTLELRGHHAWNGLHWGEDAEKTAAAWTKWLGDRFEDFAISDVKVAEAVEERKVDVTWTMAQREEEVLGDEVTLTPSRPLGPSIQPFQLPAAQRLSPILFAFGDRDEVELTVRWPEGWAPEALPSDTQAVSPAGSLTTNLEMDEPGRRLTYQRRFDLKERELGKELYGAVKSLYNQTEKHDAQAIVLVRR